MSARSPTPSSSSRARSAALRRGARIFPWVMWGAGVLSLAFLVDAGVGGSVAPGEAETRAVNVRAPSGAMVRRVLVAPGTHVQRGDVVAELETSALQLELQVALAELERLSLEVPAREVALKGGELESVQRLARESEESQLEVVRIDAELQQSRAELGQLETQIERQRELVAKKLAASGNLDELELKRASLAQKVGEFTALLAAAKKAASSSSRRLTDRTASGGGEGKESQQLAPFKAAVRAQGKRVAQLRDSIEAQQLRAPFGGRVDQVLAQAGDTLAEGGAVVSIVDTQPQSVVAYVDESWARRVKLGDEALLTPSDGVGGPRRGRVVALGPTISEIPLRFRVIPSEPGFCRRVFVSIAGEDEPPLPGQAFDVSFLGSAL